MNIISRFVAKEWFKSFFAALIVLVILMTAADMINGFLRNKSGVEQIIINFLIKFPELISKMLPITCLMATLFSLNKLKTHSELVAILATGFSPLRVLAIISICSTLIVAIQFYNTGYLIPYTKSVQTLNDEDDQLVRSKLDTGKIWYKGINYFATFSGYDAENDEIFDLNLYYHNHNHQGSNFISAKKAIYLNDNMWKLLDGKFYSQLDLNDYPSISRFKSQNIELGENPSDFKKFESDIDTLGFVSLSNYISKQELNGINTATYRVKLWDKISLSYICFLFAVIPFLSIYNPNRRSSSFGKNIVFTLVFTILYWLAHTSLLAMGNNQQLPVLLATMGIPLCFSAALIINIARRIKL